VITKLNKDQLREIAKASKAATTCAECSTLSCPGWVSVPGYYDLSKLQIVGTLKSDEAAECWDEYHPAGTHLWSELAPIAIEHHPYNRSDVRECSSCKRTFLHYTEYGGYYLDERIRELNVELII
jgi:hypothetical protein